MFTLIILILAAILGASIYCYYRMFHVTRRPPAAEEDRYDIPPGEEYESFREDMIGWTDMVRAYPHEEFSIQSFDGLTLRAKFYECKPGAPIELMFHGYKGNAERDLNGGVERCFKLGHSAMLIDHRASGYSEGNVVTFGILEKRDCLRWVDFAVEHFGPDCKLILTGISMGAATVMMAAGEELPDNVVGVLADCGFTSSRAIIYKVSRQLHLPARIMYPLIRLGALLFGGFDLEEKSAIDAMKRVKVPVIFAHGEQDTLVPCSMSWENYEACAAPKGIYTVADAGHGLCYLTAGEDYIRALREFWTEQGIYGKVTIS